MLKKLKICFDFFKKMKKIWDTETCFLNLIPKNKQNLGFRTPT